MPDSEHAADHDHFESGSASGDQTQAHSGEDLLISPALGCLISIFLGLAAVALLFGLARLLSDDEIRLGGGELTPNRVWLIRERERQGLAFSTGRVVEGSLRADRVCVETDVRFLLWTSEAPFEPIRYCDCYLKDDQTWRYQAPCEAEFP